VHLRLRPLDATPERLERLKAVLVQHRGRCAVRLHMDGPTGPTSLLLGDEFAVTPTPAFKDQVSVLFGPDALSIE